MSPRSSTSVEIDVLLRAVAISWVVLNHSQWTYELDGGMTFLFLLSGFSFARFAIRGRAATETRRSIASLCWRVWLPSFVVLALEQLQIGRLEPRDLLFVGIWFDHQRVARLDVWYLQVVLQILIGLYALFSLRPFASAFERHPLASSFGLFGVALAARALLPHVWDTSGKQHQLPHLFLWNFALGWVAYFAVDSAKRGVKLAAAACTVIAAFIAWGGGGYLPFWWLSVGTAVLLFVERVRMPAPAARTVSLISQATFAIFLLHRDAAYVYTRLPWRWHATFPRWLFAMGACVAAWVLFTAVVLAVRRMRDGPPGRRAETASTRQAAQSS